MENNKGCVYFFRHIGLTPVKIGYSNSESPIGRFEQFKTFAPYGSEIIGFIRTYDAKQLETTLHERFSAFRLSGEWFDITQEQCESVISFYSNIEDIKEKNEFQIEWAKKVEFKYNNNQIEGIDAVEIKGKDGEIIQERESVVEIDATDFSMQHFGIPEEEMTATDANNLLMSGRDKYTQEEISYLTDLRHKRLEEEGLVQKTDDLGEIKEETDENSVSSFSVPGAGIEPAQHRCHWCLRPARLPIPPSGHLPVCSQQRAVSSYGD